jgi:DNA-binding response OmpR family regulator
MKKILIIDDDADYRKLLLSFLGNAYKDVELVEYDPVENGIPGEGFDWSSYDVLILDYNLRSKDLTGIDLLKENKNNKLFPATIMLTGEGDEDIAIRALKSGVSDYLRKEKLNKEQLKSSIQEAFNSNDSRRDRLYSMAEVRHMANQEAQKLLAVYRKKYEQIRKHEEARFHAEHHRLQEELNKKQAILDGIIDSKKLAEQDKSASDNEVALLKKRLEEAEAAVQKCNWKIEQEETTARKQLEEDLKSFVDDMETQENVARILSAQLEQRQKIKEQEKIKAKAKAAENDSHLLDDISSQLGKEE